MRATANSEPVCYWIDRADRIVEVNARWDDFALQNGTPGLASRQVIGRELWDSIADGTVRHLYATILDAVRQGRRLEYAFRCDSPSLRRDMRMIVAPDDPRVRFESTVVSVSSRPPQAIWDAARPHGRELLTVCSWCKRVRAGAQWLEVEAAVPLLGLFEERALPALTHGICADCMERVMSVLG